MKCDNCRACGSDDLFLVHDFGCQPLAGIYPRLPQSTEPAKRYPLDLSLCRQCGLLQVTNLPPIHEVFNSDYRYSSSTVPGLVRHFETYANWLSHRIPAGGRVLEFGCNDGVLLERLAARGYQITGIDASDNMAQIARNKSLTVLTDFLTTEFVRRSGLQGQFDAITCSNVFAHIHDVRDTCAAVGMLLKRGGLFFIEVHDGDLLVRERQFDTVYHEHLSYFTEASLSSLLAREGFTVVECVRTSMHGGGLRFCGRFDPGASAASLQKGVPAIDSASLAKTIATCRAEIEQLSSSFGPLHGYGAAGRAQMFVNMTGTAEYFTAVYDDSPFRQGRYLVGTNVPIVPWARESGRCCVILAWNYAEAIAHRIRPHFDRIVTLLPEYTDWSGAAQSPNSGISGASDV